MLLDFDRLTVSNINRQLYALDSTMGRLKCEVAKERIRDIDPDIQVISLCERLEKDMAEDLFRRVAPLDYVVDAIDSIDGKVDLLLQAVRQGIPVISSMGMGNRRDPTKVILSCLSKTHTDPFARIIRGRLRKEDVEQLKVVFSTEVPTNSQHAGVIGSAPVVPPVAGFLMASEVIRDLISAKPSLAADEPDGGK